MRLTTASRTYARALLGGLATLLLLGACGSSEPDYYTLSTWPGVAQAGGPLTLKVRTPGVASYLDRDYIVRSAPGSKLKLAKNSAWGEPLADMIGQTLAQDLQQRLPGTNVFTESGAISTEAQAVLELNVSQFAEDGDGHAELTGAVLVTRPDSGPASSHVLHLVASPDATTTAAMTRALSKLLGQVADEAARQARALGPMPASETMPADPVVPVPLAAPGPVPLVSPGS